MVRRWIPFFLLLLAFVGRVEPSYSQEFVPIPERVLILTPDGAGEEVLELRSVLAAHLSDLNAAVEILELDEMPTGIPDQVQVARQATSHEGVLAALWIEQTADELYIFVSDRGSERVLLQTLPHSPDGPDAERDAIATLVRAALTPWLEPDPPEAAGEPAPELPSTVAPPPEPTEEPAAAKEPAPEEPPTPPGSPVHIVLGAGYTPLLGDLSRGVATHGAMFRLGTDFLRYLAVDLSVLALEPTDARSGDADIRLSRVPLELGVTGQYPLGSFDMGLRLALVVDFTHVRGIDSREAPDETELNTVGFAPSLTVRYRILDWLAVWLDGGAYLFGRGKIYEWDGEEVLRYGGEQLRIAVGAAFLLKVR